MTIHANNWTKLTPDQFFQKQEKAQKDLGNEMGALTLDEIQDLKESLGMAMDALIENLDQSSDPVCFKKHFLVIRDLNQFLGQILK